MPALMLFLLLLLVIIAIAYLYKTGRLKSIALPNLSNQLKNSRKAETAEDLKILAVLNEIDCAILSNASFERVIELVFSHISKIIPCTLVAITQLDKATSDKFGTLVATQDGRRANFPALLDVSLRQILNDKPNGYLLEQPKSHASLLPFVALGADYILMLPIYRDAELSAVLHLGFTNNAQISEFTHQVARYFADHLGVALTSVMRAKHLYYQEYYDAVTSLPNRRSCRERLSLEISRANRYHFQVAVLYINLDGFKKINDIAGYIAGDDILKKVAQRLLSHLRDADLIARISNDEFVIVLSDIGSVTSIGKVAEKISELMTQHFISEEHSHYLNVSIGISVFPENGQSVDVLLKNADTAMLRFKYKKHGKFMFYEEQMNSTTINRLTLESDLRQAIQREELFLVYQPQIDMRTGKIAGAEALVRWTHPTRGLIHPVEFIPIAEESDLIIHLGQYVRKTACKQYHAWKVQGIAPPRIALNVSSKELMHDTFIADFESMLQETSVHTSSIELEITESLLVNISEEVINSLKHLRQQGISIAIDDFGTGYSSLNYLAQLPFDVLKIDRSFVDRIGKPSETRELVSVIINIAHHFNKTLCAEGIELDSQFEFLKERGCELAQGYLLSRPLSVKDYESYLQTLQAQ